MASYYEGKLSYHDADKLVKEVYFILGSRRSGSSLLQYEKEGLKINCWLPNYGFLFPQKIYRKISCNANAIYRCARQLNIFCILFGCTSNRKFI